MEIQKSILKIMLALFVILLLNTNTFANESNSTLKIINAERKVFALNIGDARTKDYTVQISDINGIVLFEDEISASKKNSKIYDLSNLPVGKYGVEIEGDVYIRKQFVEILTHKLEVVGEEEVKIFKPSIQFKENKVSLNMFSHEAKSVQVSILDQERDEVLFEENIEDAAINKNYELSELPAGKYIVRVVTQGSSFYKEINL